MTRLLSVENAHIFYGKVEAVRGATLDVNANEIVTIVGANGAGKTTLLNAIMGILPLTGSVSFADQQISRFEIEDRVAAGLCIVPEHRELFGTMTVEENLQLGGFRVARATAAHEQERVYALFPRLKERRTQLAGTLSGGEAELAGRALMSQPRLLMLDDLLALRPDRGGYFDTATAASRRFVLLVDRIPRRPRNRRPRLCDGAGEFMRAARPKTSAAMSAWWRAISDSSTATTASSECFGAGCGPIRSSRQSSGAMTTNPAFKGAVLAIPHKWHRQGV